MSRWKKPKSPLTASSSSNPTSDRCGAASTRWIYRREISRGLPSSTSNSNTLDQPKPSPKPTNSPAAFDISLHAVLLPFCKLHHNHVMGQGVTALKANIAYRKLLEYGLARVPRPLWIKADLEEVYSKYFAEFCAGKSIPIRQKGIMYEFFSAWIVGIRAFVKEEEEKNHVATAGR